MPNILVGTQDRGGFQVIYPVAMLLKKLLHNVTVAAEGLSLGLWQDRGWGVYGGAPAKGKFDEKTLQRHDIDVYALFNEMKPDIVVVSQGAPTVNLERALALEARTRGKPVVFVEDMWGGHQRMMDAIPDLVCTLDSESARLARKFYALVSSHKVVETGSPAFDTFAEQEVPRNRNLERLVSSYRNVIYVLGQNECTTPYLQGVIEAVRVLPNTLLIVGLHPTFLTRPEHCEPWLKLVKGSKVPVVWVTDTATTYQYMKYSSVIVSCYSTGLVEGAIMGKPTVSWNSDSGRECMAKALGCLRRFPTVAYGATFEVENVDGFLKLVKSIRRRWPSESRKVSNALRTRLHVDGHAAERVVNAILQELG